MADIKNFIAQGGSIFNDNSIKINAVQNNSNVEVQQAQESSESCDEESQNVDDTKFREVFFNKDSVDKVDLCRVVIALWEAGYFVDAAGVKSRQKDVFHALGQMLNYNFSNFDKTLSEGRKKNNGSSVDLEVFESIIAAFKAYEARKK